MKTNFTFKMWRYFALSFVFAALSSNLLAQKSFNVSVTSYQYSPKEFTITAGDTVIWVNQGGFHNVDGQKSVFSSNPESFGNNLGSGWTYKFVFKTAGVYNYQCDPHVGLGMVGKITVTQKQTTAVQLAENSTEKIKVYPNPVKDFVSVLIPKTFGPAQLLRIYNIAGNLIETKPVTGNSARYDLTTLKSGVYFIQIQNSAKKEVLKFIKE